MRPFFSLLLMSFCLSCNPQEDEGEKKINRDSLNAIKDEEAQFARQKKREVEFKENMQKKGYRFVCTKECDGSALLIEGGGVVEGLHTETTLSRDSLFIDLRFMEACCQEFRGDVEKSGDTLKLAYSPNGETVCACTCEYNYRFALPAQKYKSKHLQINGYLVNANPHHTKRKAEK